MRERKQKGERLEGTNKGKDYDSNMDKTHKRKAGRGREEYWRISEGREQ